MLAKFFFHFDVSALARSHQEVAESKVVLEQLQLAIEPADLKSKGLEEK